MRRLSSRLSRGRPSMPRRAARAESTPRTYEAARRWKCGSWLLSCGRPCAAPCCATLGPWVNSHATKNATTKTTLDREELGQLSSRSCSHHAERRAPAGLIYYPERQDRFSVNSRRDSAKETTPVVPRCSYICGPFCCRCCRRPPSASRGWTSLA